MTSTIRAWFGRWLKSLTCRLGQPKQSGTPVSEPRNRPTEPSAETPKTKEPVSGCNTIADLNEMMRQTNRDNHPRYANNDVPVPDGKMYGPPEVLFEGKASVDSQQWGDVTIDDENAPVVNERVADQVDWPDVITDRDANVRPGPMYGPPEMFFRKRR